MAFNHDCCLKKNRGNHMEVNIDSYKMIDGIKFLWDGYMYEDNPKAQEIGEEYKQNNFETRIIEENGKFLVYTRREVTEIVIEGGDGF